jgi:hypothetical protein
MPYPTENYNLFSFRNVIGDTAKAYLFLVQIPAVSNPSGEEITCFARATSLPPYNIQITEIPFQGMQYKVATVPTFDNWQVEFLADEAHILRHRFLGWGAQIFDAQRQVAGSPLNYKADNIKVSQLNRVGGIVSQYNFIGMFPANVGEVSLNHSEVEPETFNVEFAYDYFTIGSGNPTSAADNTLNSFIKLDASFNVAAAVSGAVTGGVSLAGEADISTTVGANLGIRVGL